MLLPDLLDQQRSSIIRHYSLLLAQLPLPLHRFKGLELLPFRKAQLSLEGLPCCDTRFNQHSNCKRTSRPHRKLTIINNTPFIAVPQSTNIPVVQPVGRTAAIGRTTIIDGTPMLVFPGPTNIPLSDAPSGLVGATATVGRVPFLVVPSATSSHLVVQEVLL